MVATQTDWRRLIKVAAWTFVVGYALTVVVMMFLQRRLIYLPVKVSLDFAEQTAAEQNFHPWKNGSGEIIGWKLSASSKPQGSVLIVHGNGGWAVNRAYIAEPIHQAAALDVYILEYPGYGARAGSPSEKSFLSAGDEALENLPANLPVYIVGESLGTGVAAHLAQKHSSRVAGMLFFVPYNNLASLAQNHMPLFPAYFLLWDRFDPAAWLKDYHGPIKMIIAGADEVIPPRLGLQLYDGYNGTKALQVIAGAHHNDTAKQSPEWWREVLAFWQQDGQTNFVQTP